MIIPGGPNDLRLADLRAIVHEHTGIEPEHQVLVSNGRLLRGSGSTIVAEQDQGIEVVTHRRPVPEETISVRTSFGGEAIDSTYRGDAPVSDLKRFLARKYQLAPSRQVLTTLGVAMEEEDPLGAYAAGDPIVVAVAVRDVDEEWPTQPVLVLVYYRDETECASVCVDAEDTFDVLLGQLEKVGMVAQGEEVTFISGTTEVQNWRTLREYPLPSFAKLYGYSNRDRSVNLSGEREGEVR